MEDLAGKMQLEGTASKLRSAGGEKGSKTEWLKGEHAKSRNL